MNLSDVDKIIGKYLVYFTKYNFSDIRSTSTIQNLQGKELFIIKFSDGNLIILDTQPCDYYEVLIDAYVEKLKDFLDFYCEDIYRFFDFTAFKEQLKENDYGYSDAILEDWKIVDVDSLGEYYVKQIL